MNLVYSDPLCDLHLGDLRQVLAQLPERSSQMCVTSPPYFGLRSYKGLEPVAWADGWTGNLGSEPTVEAYVAHIVECFQAVKRVLRDDGTLWLNMGDSFAGNPGNGRGGESPDGGVPHRSGQIKEPDQAGQLLGVPWRVALALQQDGWRLRSDIIWHKPAPMPESVNGWRWERCRVKTAKAPQTFHGYGVASRLAPDGSGGVVNAPSATWAACPGCPRCEPNGGLVLRKGSWRPTRSHEYIFLFAKGERYFCDGEAVREPQGDWNPVTIGGSLGMRGSTWMSEAQGGRNGDRPAQKNPAGRNKRSVWTIGPEPLNLAVKVKRQVNVSVDEATDDMERIGSSGCPVHGPRLDSSRSDDVPQPELPSRNFGTLTDPAQAPLAGLFATPGQFLTPPDNSGSQVPSGFPSAKQHNKASHRMAREPLTNPSYTASEGIQDHIEHREELGVAESQRPDNPANSSETDDFGVHPSPHTAGDNVGTPSGRHKVGPCTCSYTKVSTDSISHFASFPTEIPRLCIQAGTSEAGCCATCGAPWARIVEQGQLVKNRPSAGDDPRSRNEDILAEARGHGGWQGNNLLREQSTTLGWRPTCTHAGAPVPMTVLDPFAGTGSTAVAAKGLGRRSIMVEANPAYIALAVRRITEAQPALAVEA